MKTADQVVRPAYPKMNPEWKVKWLEALRSGRWSPGLMYVSGMTAGILISTLIVWWKGCA